MTTKRLNIWLLCFAITCFTCISNNCHGQAVPDTSLKNVFRDSTRTSKSEAEIDSLSSLRKQNSVTYDTTGAAAPKKGPFQPNAKKAGMYSAIFPGMGQLYNRQYWKLPVIYAGIAVAAYFFEYNYQNYQTYHQAYIASLANPTNYPFYSQGLTSADLNQFQNDYQRYLNLTALFAGIGYAVQILDAITFAYLKNFDMSRDISVHFRPVAYPNGAGLGLVVNF